MIQPRALPAEPEARPAPEAVTIRSGDADLAGTLFLPPGAPAAAVVLHGATGVPQGYYAAFATWLAAEKGLACLTYDYRGFGRSATGPARTSRATMADWGLTDQDAAAKALAARLPHVPLWVIGHSLGGMMLNFHDIAPRIERAILVASGPVNWRDHPARRLPAILAFWFLIGPAATLALGYMPGRRIGFGADLPRGVYWQWRRWCLSRGFALADLGRALPLPDWHRVRARIKFVAVADDADVPPHVVWRLMRFYPAARRRQLTLRPEAYGLPRIGHVGAFHPRARATWDDIVADPAEPAPATAVNPR